MPLLYDFQLCDNKASPRQLSSGFVFLHSPLKSCRHIIAAYLVFHTLSLLSLSSPSSPCLPLPPLPPPPSLPPLSHFPSKNRELEICVHSRDGEVTVLSGLLYLRLEDYFDTSSTTYCLPLEPQGILLAEVRGKGRAHYHTGITHLTSHTTLHMYSSSHDQLVPTVAHIHTQPKRNRRPQSPQVEGQLNVCRLDHSGLEPFNCTVTVT